VGADGVGCRGRLAQTIGEVDHSWGGPSVAVGGAAVARGAIGVSVATCGIAGDAWAM
jgi:hypothetical protein